MKILVDYDEASKTVISVENAVYLGDYVLEILFNNETRKTVSFKEFLSSSLHPSINKYFNENMFTKFKIRGLKIYLTLIHSFNLIPLLNKSINVK